MALASGLVQFRIVLAGASPSPDLGDLEAVFRQLTALFRVAWAVSDDDTLRIEAEFRSRFPQGTGGEPLLLERYPAAAPPLPRLRSLSIDSTLELRAELRPEFLQAGGAVAALAALAARAFDVPLQGIPQLEAERASWEAQRTTGELAVLTHQGEALRALAPQNLDVRQLELVAAPEREDAS